MKLNKETLKRIIKEELDAVLDESVLLKKFKAKKENELMKKFQDMGKKPRKTFNALRSHSPDQLASIGSALVPGYPEHYAGTPSTKGYKAMLDMDPEPNPYGGRFYFMFEPEDFAQRTNNDDDANKGSLSLFVHEPMSSEMEFVNAYTVDDLDEELRRLAKEG